jgi:hypothetical protein
MKNHKWSKEDDIVAFYLYKFGRGNLSYSIEDISNKLGMSTASMKMRIKNFKFLNKHKGLKNYAKLSEKVYEEYKDYKEAELRHLVESILSKK